MADDLMNIDADTGGGDEDSWGTWLLGVAAVLAAVVVGWWILSWLFGIVFGVVWWLLKWGLAAAAVYMLYRAVRWMFSSGSDTDHETSVSEPSISTDDDVTLGEEPAVGEVTADDLDVSGDASLDREFEELERNMSDEDLN